MSDDNRRLKDVSKAEPQCYMCPGEHFSCSNCMMQHQLDRISELEASSASHTEELDKRKGWGLAIDQIDSKYKQEIAELKEQFSEHLHGEYTIREVLREWGKRITNLLYNEKLLHTPEAHKSLHDILEKLDGSKKKCSECGAYMWSDYSPHNEGCSKVGSVRQTDCIHEWVNTTENQIRCDKCDQLKWYHLQEYECDFTPKASGGEKTITSETGQKSIDGNKETKTLPDSKPPEPKKKLMVIMDEDTIFDLNEPIDEPREDDKENVMFGVFSKETHVLVKREKIEFWRKELLNSTNEVLQSMRKVLGID